MEKETYRLVTSKGAYDIEMESRIVVYTSTLIKDLEVTICFPDSWSVTRVFQHILAYNSTLSV